MKVDPRTGKATAGLKKKAAPLKPLSSTDTPVAQPPIQEQPPADYAALLAAIKQLSDDVVSQLKLLRIAPGAESVPEDARKIFSMTSIDEGLIDVGIGETEDLKVGEDSAMLAKEATQKDTSLKSSKTKLNALKAKKTTSKKSKKQAK